MFCYVTPTGDVLPRILPVDSSKFFREVFAVCSEREVRIEGIAYSCRINFSVERMDMPNDVSVIQNWKSLAKLRVTPVPYKMDMPNDVSVIQLEISCKAAGNSRAI
ncbi:hypothetical protein J6590_076625 [Homalodisca vitripennis]|nr:hypothetical protein J6590_076625 [Homalodisca vitripennis]